MFKKTPLIFVVLALLAVYAEANGPAVRLFGNKKHPTLEDHCYDTEHKVSVKLHEFAYPTNLEYNQCLKFECLDDYVLSVEACSKNCVLVSNSVPFPDCCKCAS